MDDIIGEDGIITVSGPVFPVLPGLKWDVVKQPEFSTKIQRSASGREARAAFWTYPLWTYKLGYELLRDDATNELDTLLGFFLARRGAFDSFLFLDPDDNTITGQAFGIGDGVTAAFQLQRTLGAFTEPCRDIKGTPTIYVDGTFQNRITYSEQFDNASWTKQNGTITANATTAPDGNTTADKLVEGVTTADCLCFGMSSGNVVGGKCTVSVYLKPAGRTWAMMNTGGTPTNTAVWFNLSTGTIGTKQANVVDAKITSAGNGWFRCSVTFVTTDTAARMSVYTAIADAVTTHLGDGVSGLYLWGAQIEMNDHPSTYRATVATAYFSGVTVSNKGVATFPSAPLLGAVLTADFSYYWRCRFLEDKVEFSKFMTQLWECKKLEFITVRS